MNSQEITKITKNAIESVIKNLKENRNILLNDYQESVQKDSDNQLELAELLVKIQTRIKKSEICLKHWLPILKHITETIETSFKEMNFIDVDFETDVSISAVNIIINHDIIIMLEYIEFNEFTENVKIIKKTSNDGGYTFSANRRVALYVNMYTEQTMSLNIFINKIIKDIKRRTTQLSTITK